MSSLMSLLLADQYTVKCSVRALATGDVNSPAPTTIATDLPMLLLSLSAKTKAAMTPGYMEGQAPTHSAQATESSYLQIGFQVVETHTKDEFGRWQAFTGETYLILGKSPLAGAPSDWQQVTLDLMQVSAVT